MTLYVILDGFDLGLGILFPFAPEEERRDVMMNTVAPFWDGNETWLVLGGGGLFVAFPKAYGVIMSGLYLPITIMLLALVFRGVAFEFRWVAKPKHQFWDRAFAWGSIVAAFSQGVVLGGLSARASPSRMDSLPEALSTGSRRFPFCAALRSLPVTRCLAQLGLS